MNQSYLEKMYNNPQYQDFRWNDMIYWSTAYISSLRESEIRLFHHDKMAHLSVTQRQAFTAQQKTYMNEPQMAKITA